jgi:hypothetical protein
MASHGAVLGGAWRAALIGALVHSLGAARVGRDGKNLEKGLLVTAWQLPCGGRSARRRRQTRRRDMGACATYPPMVHTPALDHMEGPA